MKFYFGLVGLLSVALFLSGCLGGEIVGRHPESSTEFPSLSTVPDRPLKEDESTSQQETPKADDSLQDAKKFNQELRQYFGVPDGVDGK